MPPTRQQHDPFTDAPLRPTTGNATSLAPSAHNLRGQASQHSLRSNASTASLRSRQQGALFAPSLSRRPTSRATPSFDDDVLADEEDEEVLAAAAQQHRRGGLRQARLKHGSPESKHARLQKSKQEAEVEFVRNAGNEAGEEEETTTGLQGVPLEGAVSIGEGRRTLSWIWYSSGSGVGENGDDPGLSDGMNPS